MKGSKAVNIDKKEILCTLGPSSLNDYTLARLTELGVDLLRINLSHTKIEDLEDIIQYIRKQTPLPICLDTEGAQIRTGRMAERSLYLRENEILEIARQDGRGDAGGLSFYPEEILPVFQEGDLISIDFNSVLAQIMENNSRGLKLRIITGGKVGPNKAVTILNREVHLPVLTKKDLQALKIGKALGIAHVALSFANRGTDVDFVRRRTSPQTRIISKIESLSGFQNLEDIARKSDALLIDRGDLSRQAPIDMIPRMQKQIVSQARQTGVKVYVATNLLESMVRSPNPTRAEVNDIFNTLCDGADGLVLAAETAIGSYPVHCVMMVSKMIRQFDDHSRQATCKAPDGKGSFLLIEPHGGNLVNGWREIKNRESLKKYPSLSVDLSVLMSAEQLALGTFSPLTGFMNQEEVESVLKEYRLPSGVIWTLPIVLQTSARAVKGLSVGETIALKLKKTEDVYALLQVRQIFRPDLQKMAQDTFGTTDVNHPGVHQLFTRGEYFVGGPVELIRRLPSPYKHYELTPRQVRTIFEHRGWSKVVGFHTRNVIHCAHEHIQMLALEQTHCDGLFVHPVAGPKKKGDYTFEIIMKGYEVMMEKYYPAGKVMVAAFQAYSRYAGPREAVFTALCRKNFGCSHFIVGRDHTGVGNYYQPGDVERLFERLGDIGIIPLFFNAQHYCEKCRSYVDNCRHGEEYHLSISGTAGRRMLTKGKQPPEWFMRKEISDLIIRDVLAGKEVFVA